MSAPRSVQVPVAAVLEAKKVLVVTAGATLGVEGSGAVVAEIEETGGGERGA